MQEKLNNFVDNLKIRFTDPLFFSFLISWSITNWKVWIYLIYSEQFPSNTLNNIQSYLNEVRIFKLFWLPISLALVYTLGYPYIKWALSLIRQLAILGTYKIENADIAIKKYHDLKNKISSLENDLQNKHKEMRELSDKFNSLSEESQKQKNSCVSDLNDDARFINEYRAILYSLLQIKNPESTQLSEIRHYIQENDNILNDMLREQHRKINKKYGIHMALGKVESFDDPTSQTEDVKDKIELRKRRLNRIVNDIKEEA